MRILTLTLCIACAAAFGTSAASAPESAHIAPLQAAADRVRVNEARVGASREQLRQERQKLEAIRNTGDKTKIRAAQGTTRAAQSRLRGDLADLAQSREALEKLRDPRTMAEAKQDGDRIRAGQATARAERERLRAERRAASAARPPPPERASREPPPDPAAVEERRLAREQLDAEKRARIQEHDEARKAEREATGRR